MVQHEKTTNLINLSPLFVWRNRAFNFFQYINRMRNFPFRIKFFSLFHPSRIFDFWGLSDNIRSLSLATSPVMNTRISFMPLLWHLILRFYLWPPILKSLNALLHTIYTFFFTLNNKFEPSLWDEQDISQIKIFNSKREILIEWSSFVISQAFIVVPILLK